MSDTETQAGSRTRVIDHISVGVTRLAAARAFYDRALAPLGLVAVLAPEGAGGAGYGRPGGWPTFWIQEPVNGAPPSPGNGAHVCFAAASRDAVDDFYVAAVAAGGEDAGAPGLRLEYHPNYYGAFVRDPWGNKLEAAFHGAA